MSDNPAKDLWDEAWGLLGTSLNLLTSGEATDETHLDLGEAAIVLISMHHVAHNLITPAQGVVWLDDPDVEAKVEVKRKGHARILTLSAEFSCGDSAEFSVTLPESAN